MMIITISIIAVWRCSKQQYSLTKSCVNTSISWVFSLSLRVFPQFFFISFIKFIQNWAKCLLCLALYPITWGFEGSGFPWSSCSQQPFHSCMARNLSFDTRRTCVNFMFPYSEVLETKLLTKQSICSLSRLFIFIWVVLTIDVETNSRLL